MKVKVKNHLQIHILHLLEIEPNMQLFTELSEAWKYNSVKQVVHQAFMIAHLSHKEV